METYFAVLLAILTYRAMQAAPALIRSLFARFEWRDYRLTLWGKPNERGGRSGRYLFDFRSQAYRRKEREDYINEYL